VDEADEGQWVCGWVLAGVVTKWMMKTEVKGEVWGNELTLWGWGTQDFACCGVKKLEKKIKEKNNKKNQTGFGRWNTELLHRNGEAILKSSLKWILASCLTKQVKGHETGMR
jgi:hypothetical protein